MFESRKKGRRPESRAFRPLLDGRLETRMLLSSQAARTQKDLAISHFLLEHPAEKNAFSLNKPPHLAKHAPQFFGRTRRRSGVAATETAGQKRRKRGRGVCGRPLKAGADSACWTTRSAKPAGGS